MGLRWLEVTTIALSCRRWTIQTYKWCPLYKTWVVYVTKTTEQAWPTLRKFIKTLNTSTVAKHFTLRRRNKKRPTSRRPIAWFQTLTTQLCMVVMVVPRKTKSSFWIIMLTNKWCEQVITTTNKHPDKQRKQLQWSQPLKVRKTTLALVTYQPNSLAAVPALSKAHLSISLSELAPL